MAVIKYLMFFFNFLFWLSGLALIIIGAVIRDKYGNYFSYADNSFANVPVFLIVVGVIVFCVGFLGCCGAIKENYCMVTTFAVLLGIIFILEIVAGAVGFAYKSKVEEKATKGLDRAKDKYKEEPGAKSFLDWAQQKFECCEFNKTVCINSCHSDKDCKNNSTRYTKDCKDGFTDFVENNLVVIGAVALAIAFVQILGIIFACCLMKAIKGEYEVV